MEADTESLGAARKRTANMLGGRRPGLGRQAPGLVDWQPKAAQHPRSASRVFAALAT